MRANVKVKVLSNFSPLKKALRTLKVKALSICLAAAALAALPSCKKGAASACASDQQCAPGFSCDPATGACRCAADSSCAATETCNAAGFCQPRLRCDSSADCAPGSLCDTQSGVCIAQGACNTLDVQCKAGEVCKDFACVPGCRHDGDCAAATDVCRPCAAGTPAAQCPSGNACVRGRCDSQLTCPYGDTCSPDGQGDQTCQPDDRGPFCQPCSRQAGSPEYCPDATGHGSGNYCLIDTSVPLGQAFYCGVDCTEGQECPNGYRCRDVRIVTAGNCKPADGLAACAARTSGVSCDPAKNHPGTAAGIVNDDCDNALPPLVGAVCDPASRQCVPQCLGTGETGIQAFCSCLVDSDCTQDSCDSSSRSCVISGRPCIVGLVPDDCQSTHAIRCVKVEDPRLGSVGYCRIGQNCAPGEGFTCEYLRSH
jgi:hypothetical protein